MQNLRGDNFRNRGAVEQESPEQKGNLNFRAQLGHRNKGPLIDSHDTDFPEPGENPEHTGEALMREEKTSKNPRDENEDELRDTVDQDPGMRQKESHNDEKDDPLAA